MQDHTFPDNDFLNRLVEIIDAHLSEENFGVSELAAAAGMSRSNLLRRIKAATQLSASQFMRQVRLKRGLELLQQTSCNVSEAAYKVGFASTSYFIKCFREYYGYPPGEVGKRAGHAAPAVEVVTKGSRHSYGWKIPVAGGLVLSAIAMALWFTMPRSRTSRVPLEKSIAVLPFKNDSNDSTNVYLINGLMESTLNNLQKIKDLRVISRTSVEQYRTTTKTIPEMGAELKVSYFVEGSGQKIGDRILLNIQLIEAATDRHLWARQYQREAKDIFMLQQEIARSIADEIEVIITPEEQERINKAPTANLEAYDFFLKGLDLLHQGGSENLLASIAHFREAIARDGQFALAYASTAIAYYYLDIYMAEKKYTAEINSYADKALLLDPRAPQSLMAKGMYYIQTRDYEKVPDFLEKALEYGPNSATIINLLSDFYANHSPNTAKYLQYALRGVQLDIAAHDSVTISYIYLHLSNALIQSGFAEEALHYADLSLAYNPQNYYTPYLRVFILYARDRDADRTRDLLLAELKKDTTRVDLLQEVAKIYFYQREYQQACHYYEKFLRLREAYQLDVYRHEHLRIGATFAQVGQAEKAHEFIEDYRRYLATDKSIYRSLGWASYYAYRGENEKALEQIERFSQADHVQYWIILFLEFEPIMDDIKKLPEFKILHDRIKATFWRNHEELKTRLKDQGLI